MGLDVSREKNKFVNQDTINDRFIRKCTMINIIILLLIIALYKIFVLVGCGYYTFRKVDRPDCYASEESEKPTSKRIEESDKNVT
jgi:hypothetical protein